MATQAEIREAQRAYMKNWRKQNPEKNKQYIERYWSRRIERMKAAENLNTSDQITADTNTQTAGTAPEKERNK